jgi:CrcB protein
MATRIRLLGTPILRARAQLATQAQAWLGKFLLIGTGGFLGANLRYGVQTWATGQWGSGFPYGTLLANVTGSFILAFFITLATQRAVISPALRLFFAVGFLGGYTTFSSFTVDTISLIQAGNWSGAGLNILGNVGLGFLGAFAGVVAARLL